MKGSFYFKVLSLLLTLFMEATLAMEKPESAHVTPISRHISRTLKTLCVKKINSEIRENPFFAIEEAQRYNQKHNPLDLNAVYEVLNACQLMPGHQTEDPEDPPFFLLRGKGHEIYVLGSQHVVPLYRCLLRPTLEELRRVATLNPVIYTEHETTNKAPLAMLENPENHIDSELLAYNFDLLYQIFLPEAVGEEFRECVRKKPLLLNMTEASNVEVSEALTSQVWLGAILLGTHANLLSSQKYGGLETNLTYGQFWKAYWRDQKFLETHEEVLNIQKKHEREGKDDEQNRTWAQKSIRSIILFMKYNEEKLEQRHNELWAENLERYSWEALKFSKRGKIPESAIERQHLWAQRLLQDIHTEQSVPARLVVIGDGHLTGYTQGWSFLSFLNSKLKWPLFRFSNTKGWVLVN